jgi:hypothetical protein
MEKFFERILDDDEKIEKIVRPNKCKYFFSNLFIWGITFALFTITGLIGVLAEDYEAIYILIPIGIWVVLMFFAWIFMAIYYKNLYYAYTNKRVIIRSGIFGVDFKSLDMSMIGAVNVYVSVIDKILRKDTGSIMFGSTASPIGGQNAGLGYRFNHIVMPYETCKEVKMFIDNYKKKIQSK